MTTSPLNLYQQYITYVLSILGGSSQPLYTIFEAGLRRRDRPQLLKTPIRTSSDLKWLYHEILTEIIVLLKYIFSSHLC